MSRVLVLEADHRLASSIARELRARNIEVVIAPTVGEAETLTDFDLVLCDVALPDRAGLDFIAKTAARRPDVAIIALSTGAEEADIVAALMRGAVDYVTKPFRPAELLARVDAQLRLRKAMTTPPASVIHVGDLRIDLDSRRVRAGSTDVELRPKEFDLLVCLALGVGNVIRRARLMSEVWGEEWWGSTKTLDVHINSVRRKLGEQPGRPSRITAVRGVGYRLEPR